MLDYQGLPDGLLIALLVREQDTTKMDSSSPDPNIVQVFDTDETHLYGTFVALPDYRLRPAGRPIITFDETPAGSPEAVKTWFYPGETHT